MPTQTTRIHSIYKYILHIICNLSRKLKINESDYTIKRPWISLLKSVNALIRIESGSVFHSLDEK